MTCVLLISAIWLAPVLVVASRMYALAERRCDGREEGEVARDEVPQQAIEGDQDGKSTMRVAVRRHRTSNRDGDRPCEWAV